MARRAHPLLMYFVLSHIAGLLAALQLNDTAISQSTTVINETPSSGLYMFLIIALTSVIMLGLIKFRATNLIKVWFLTALFATSLIFFSAFFPLFLAVAITVGVFINRYFTPELWMRNLSDSISYAGAGALFGTMIGPRGALVFLVLLGIYDIVSVLFTKHMITLVQGGMESNTFMGLMHPREADTKVDPDELTEGGEDDIDQFAEEQEDSEDSGSIGFVGGGDIIVPMIFSIALIPHYGLATAIATSIGATVGFGLLLDRASGDEFYPAIPIIGSGALAGFILVTGLSVLGL